MSDVEKRVIKTIRNHLERTNPGSTRLVRSTDLLEADLGFDSITTVELVLALEEEFGIDIPDEAVTSAAVVADLVTAVTNTPSNTETKPAPTVDWLQTKSGEAIGVSQARFDFALLLQIRNNSEGVAHAIASPSEVRALIEKLAGALATCEQEQADHLNASAHWHPPQTPSGADQAADLPKQSTEP